MWRKNLVEVWKNILLKDKNKYRKPNTKSIQEKLMKSNCLRYGKETMKNLPPLITGLSLILIRIFVIHSPVIGSKNRKSKKF